MEITYRPIGVLHSPFTSLDQMPIQPTAEASAPGVAEIQPEFADGLRDLDGFSHVILIYHLHEVRRTHLTVTPFLDSEPRGVFATRAPTRPNAIGLSVVALEGIEGTRLLQIQGAMGLPMVKVGLGREAVYSILAFLKRHRSERSPRGVRFELSPGAAPH